MNAPAPVVAPAAAPMASMPAQQQPIYIQGATQPVYVPIYYPYPQQPTTVAYPYPVAYSTPAPAAQEQPAAVALPVPEYKLEKSFIDKMTVFGKSVVTLAESDIKYIYTGSGDPIRYRAGLSEFLRSEKPELSLAKKSNPMTAEDVLKKEKELVDSNWNNYLKQVS